MIPASSSYAPAERKFVLHELYTDGSAAYTNLKKDMGKRLVCLQRRTNIDPHLPNEWAEPERQFSNYKEMTAYAQALTHWHRTVQLAALEQIFKESTPNWPTKELKQHLAEMPRYLPALAEHKDRELIATLNTPKRLNEWIVDHPEMRPYDTAPAL
jgi:hypothetical protein